MTPRLSRSLPPAARVLAAGLLTVGCADASSEQLIQKVHATETVQIGIAKG